MVNFTKVQNGNVLVVRIEGSIEESVNLEQLIGPPPAELHVNCRNISRINSVGVKGWIKYFQTAQKMGTKLKFLECSTAIVEQINLISNFHCGGEIESIFVPFACKECKAEVIGLFKCTDLKARGVQVLELKCPKCGGRAVFDDIEEDFFGFLHL